jgi:hypothetical protein
MQKGKSQLDNESLSSDLFTRLPSRGLHQPRAIQQRGPHISDESQSSDSVRRNGWQHPEAQLPKHDKIEEAAVPDDQPSIFGNNLTTARESGFYFGAPGPKHARNLPTRLGSRQREVSNRAADENVGHSQQRAMHDSQFDSRPNRRVPSEVVPRESDLSDEAQVEIKEIMANETSATLHMDTLLSPLPSFTATGKTGSTSPMISSQETGSKSLLDLEPEAEIARFPTIFQLEKDGLRSVKSKSTTSQGNGATTNSLLRANTVTSSNPAARLLRPFDPAAEGPGVPSSTHSLPRRSGTERYRRRPYAEQFSGMGRTLWEEFERAGSQAQSTVSRLPSRPETGTLDVAPSNPSSSIDRSKSLNHHQSTNYSRPYTLLPMRSALDLSATQRNSPDLPVSQPQHRLTAATSTPNLVRCSATDAANNCRRSKQVESCIRTLQEMGYKPHSRLPVYAEACDGNISKAMSMAEEDEKATQETRKTSLATEKVLICIQTLKEMGYGKHHQHEELKRFARDAEGDVALAIEGMEQRRERRRLGFSGQQAPDGPMPGSFP